MVLVDANVFLDVLTQDSEWLAWSDEHLITACQNGIAINPIIYAEMVPAFQQENKLRVALDDLNVSYMPLPYKAAFSASRAYVSYRKRGGQMRSPLPDFYIGAHAQVENMQLLTRDTNRYQTYFPEVQLICPEAP